MFDSLFSFLGFYGCMYLAIAFAILSVAIFISAMSYSYCERRKGVQYLIIFVISVCMFLFMIYGAGTHAEYAVEQVSKKPGVKLVVNASHERLLHKFPNWEAEKYGIFTVKYVILDSTMIVLDVD